MKATRLFLAVMIAVLAFSGTASAFNLHIVEKGDTLSKIAKKYNVNWKEIYQENKTNIKDPNRIYPGWALVIPEMETYDEFSYEHPGADKFRGTLDEALKLLEFPVQVADALKEKVAKGEFEWTEIKKGDRFKMTFGKNKVRKAVANWKDENTLLAAKQYTVIVGEVEYTLLYPLACGNWSWLKIKVKPPVPPTIPPSPPPQKVVPPPVTPPQIQLVPPKPIQPKIQITFRPPVVAPSCTEIEHEPIIGAGTWANGLAKGNFAYGEYLLWLKTKCGSEYAFGVGIYGNWEEGESKVSSYDWDGYGVGPQLGLKRSYSYQDKKGKRRLQQWVLKTRLIWEHTEGEGSNKSGYAMEQDNLKLGGYGEYVRQLDDKWTVIGTGEGWYALHKTIDSTWSGDSPSDRTQLAAGLYGQYKINENWQTRFGGGPFYQGWDEMTGLHLRAELRWKETVMFGPYANLFPFGKTSIYNGIATSDLQTYGAFIRIEFGKIIRDWDQRRRMERIRKMDEELYPINENVPAAPEERTGSIDRQI